MEGWRRQMMMVSVGGANAAANSKNSCHRLCLSALEGVMGGWGGVRV